LPDTESQRLALLYRYEIPDTPEDAAFDRITELAARMFQGTDRGGLLRRP
jgi:hypothetical protein